MMIIIVFTIIGFSWVLFEILSYMAMKKDQSGLNSDLCCLLMECSMNLKPNQKKDLKKRLNQSFSQNLEICRSYGKQDAAVFSDKMPLLYVNNACLRFLEEVDCLESDRQQECRLQMKEAALIFQEVRMGIFDTAPASAQIARLKAQSLLPSFEFLCQILEEMAGISAPSQEQMYLSGLLKG